jgi:hypothetical protein
LDYGEEVHQSRILGDWSNMIGNKMGFRVRQQWFVIDQEFSSEESFKHA